MFVLIVSFLFFTSLTLIIYAGLEVAIEDFDWDSLDGK